MLKLSLYQDRIQTSNYPIIEKIKSKQIDEYHYQKGNVILSYNYEYAKRRTLYLRKSIERARKSVEFIGTQNKFTHFVSITFNQKYVDRKDVVAVHRKYQNIMKRMKYVYGEFEYLRVPEFHQDGSVHYHLFINYLNRKPKLKYKGKTEKGIPYYTIQDEDFNRFDCFLTLEKINGIAPIHYLTKYITKSSDCPLSRRYACSKSLKKPQQQNKPLASYTFEEEYRDDWVYSSSDLAFELAFGSYSKCQNNLITTFAYGSVAASQHERSEVLDLFSPHIKYENVEEYRAKLKDVFFREVLLLMESGKKCVSAINTLA